MYIPCFLICRQHSRATLTLVKRNICKTFSLLRKRSSWTQPAWLTVTSFSPLILVKVVLYSNESSLCHRETGERREKRAVPCGRAESLISVFISVHLQKNNESHENQKTGEPRDSEEGEEPLEIEIEPREPGKRSERTGNHSVFMGNLGSGVFFFCFLFFCFFGSRGKKK